MMRVIRAAQLGQRARRPLGSGGIGAWLQALEDDGEDTAIRIGSVAAPGEQPQWYFRPHARMDGIAAFESVLESFGVETVCSLGATGGDRTAGCEGPSLWYRIALEHSLPAAPWRVTRRGDTSSRGDVLAWKVLTPNETARVDSIAAEHEISANTYLLHALQKAVWPDLDPTRGDPRWMVPVSMRRYYPDAANALSYVSVRLRAGMSAADLHRQIRHRLAAGEQWAAWRALRAASAWGPRAVATALDHAGRTGPQFTGLFSNLGDWRAVRGSFAGAWVMCPPVSRLAPFAAAAVRWNGQLGLCLQAHMIITLDAGMAQVWMERWTRQLMDGPGRQWFFLSTSSA